MPRRRGLARRKGFGSGCKAGATNAVAIAPQPAHAQLCREVDERSGQDASMGACELEEQETSTSAGGGE
jgi:hypothetical protein